MLEDLRSGDHLRLDVAETSGELDLVVCVRDPADVSGIHPRRAVDAGENRLESCDVGLMNEHHSGSIQTGEQSLDMMSDPEAKDEHTRCFRGIDPVGPGACFDQRLMQTCQSAPFGDQADGGTVSSRLEGDGTSLDLLDSSGDLG